MSQDIGIGPNLRVRPFCLSGLVVAGGVEDELTEEFAGVGVDDADVAVEGQQDDVGAAVGPSDADVVQAAVVADRDRSGGVDAVAADPWVGWGDGGGRGGFGSGSVGAGRGSSAQRAVRALLVVVVGESVE